MIDTADRLDILDVLARANRASDQKDVEKTQKLYTADGEIVGDMQASADNFAEELQAIYDGEPGLKRHVGSSHIFCEDGEEAVVSSLLTVFEGDEAPGVVATAEIEDRLVKLDGEWRIKRHQVLMDPGTKKAMQQG